MQDERQKKKTGRRNKTKKQECIMFVGMYDGQEMFPVPFAECTLKFK